MLDVLLCNHFCQNHRRRPTFSSLLGQNGKQSNHIFRLLFKHASLPDSPCSATLHECQTNQMPSRS